MALAGREILYATLKATSRFHTMQQAFAATGFDASSPEQIIADLKAQVRKLTAENAEQARRIKELEAKQRDSEEEE